MQHRRPFPLRSRGYRACRVHGPHLSHQDSEPRFGDYLALPGRYWQRGNVEPPAWSTVAKTSEDDYEQVGSLEWGSPLGWWDAADGTQTLRTVTVTRWRFATTIHVADEVNHYHHARTDAMQD